MADNLPREFLHERDARIFSLKKSGLSNQDIAKRFDMTAAAVAAATRRQLNRLNSEAFLSYPEVLRLELERLDEMQKSLWPLTQFRRETLDDGSQVTIEPDQRAVQTVLGKVRDTIDSFSVDSDDDSPVGVSQEIITLDTIIEPEEVSEDD